MKSTKANATNERVLKWLLSGDTGLSSNAIVRKLTGYDKTSKDQDDNSTLESVQNYPHDSDDFGRCYRLLEAIPEFKPRLKEMVIVNKYWKGLVENWKLLEVLYKLEPSYCSSVIRMIETNVYYHKE